MDQTFFIMGYAVNVYDNFDDIESFNSFVSSLKKIDEKPKNGQPYFLIGDYDPEQDDIGEIVMYLAYDFWFPGTGKLNTTKLNELQTVVQDDKFDDEFFSKLSISPYYGLYLEVVSLDLGIVLYTI